jgi:glucosamine-6-phosphate deaminase
MRVIIRDDPDQVGSFAAQYIRNRIQQFHPTAEKPFVLGLPTGSTPVITYKYLIDMYRRGELSFENIITFNMDEYVGLPQSHPQSYHNFMYENFFKHINIQTQNVHILGRYSVYLHIIIVESYTIHSTHHIYIYIHIHRY